MKKAQIQFMETIFVLLIVIILLFIGIFFYYFFSYKGIEETKSEFTDIDSIILTDSIIGMPELTCGINCIDSIKLMAFKEKYEKDPAFKRHFNKIHHEVLKNKKITLKIVYPQAASHNECTLEMFENSDYPHFPVSNPSVDKPFICDHYVIYSPPTKEIAHLKPYILENPVSVYFQTYKTPSKDIYAMGLLKIEVFK